MAILATTNYHVALAFTEELIQSIDKRDEVLDCRYGSGRERLPLDGRDMDCLLSGSSLSRQASKTLCLAQRDCLVILLVCMWGDLLGLAPN
jgi:hypothetical protein